MKKNACAVSILAAALFLSFILVSFDGSASARPKGENFIQTDGTVVGTNNIKRNGDIYTFTTDIAGSVTIERDNVVLDGKGFSLQADRDADFEALTMPNRNNVTILNLVVVTSGSGIMLNHAAACKIVNVTVQAERAGIRTRNLNNSVIADCSIEAHVEYGLTLSFSPDNVVANNTIITSMNDAVNCGYSPNSIITGNTLTYQPSEFPLARGIEFDGSPNCTICQNHIKGFPMTGINLQGYSHNNTIEANDVINCENGIRISSDRNILTQNYVANCSGAGISLDSAQGNLLRSNQLNSNGQNLAVSSYTAAGWLNDVDASNWVDLKPAVYWVNEADKVVPTFTGCIILVNCTGITVQKQSFTGKGDGVLMVYTQNSTITNNYASENSTINLYGSSENKITENQLVNNDKGLFLESSSFNNIVVANVFRGNNYGVFLSSSSSNTLTENNFR
jgi:trimeric autotransporter adhesin